MFPGDHDIEAAVDELAAALPERLVALARIAYDYRWVWSADGPALFAGLDPDRWHSVGHNPVRFLVGAPRALLERVNDDDTIVARVERLAAELAADRMRPWPPQPDRAIDTDHPVAFFCAEFGVHDSLPIYSGGLGVLAGDILKEASDLAVPMVAIGLLYRTGYFHQRIDVTGMQHEYWLESDPDDLPCVQVTDPEGRPVIVTVPVDDEDISAQVWRVDVGRVPLYLLDTNLPTNSDVGRWVTSRLYESNREIRLAQYAVLGVGGVRALRALGIEPAVCHFNEGHPVLGVFEMLASLRSRGVPDDAAWQAVREQVVFTTHTPVPAGNETYSREEIVSVLGRVADLAGDRERALAEGRLHPRDTSEPSGMTALALRMSRSANGVSRRHGQVAREMWQPIFPGRSVDEVPISYVTNGVHVPTWLRGSMRALLDRYLPEDWLRRADDPATWEAVDDIPAVELWAARNAARSRLIELVSHRSTSDRLRRGEPLDYAAAAGTGLDPDRLTIGFARRLATYKRLHLLSLMPERALAFIDGPRPLQFVFAGKAHPADAEAKEVVRALFTLKGAPQVAGRVAFLEDYDMRLGAGLVAGCDVWVNTPRPPLEASGTSGMKSVLNGGLQLSVLDGWWAEGYAGTNGWAIDGSDDADHGAQDLRHAAQLFDLLEHEVVPMFHDRDAQGIPQRWVDMIRASLRTSGPRFSATRMVREYATSVYPSADAV